MQRSDTAERGGTFLVDHSCLPSPSVSMDVLANHSIFQELQLVHDTGYFSAMPSLEENWQQVCGNFRSFFFFLAASSSSTFPPPNAWMCVQGADEMLSITHISDNSSPLMAKWIRCERKPARNKAVKCDLGRWRSESHNRDWIGRE